MNSYIAAVRKCGRMASLFLLLLLILGSAGSHQARANGVVSTIGNGQIVYGSISASGFDTYSFPVGGTNYEIFWTITTTSAYNINFEGEAELFKPSGGVANYAIGHYFGSSYVGTSTIAAGTWKIEVSNAAAGPTYSGTYALQVFWLPGQPGQSGGVGGGQMNVGQTYSGSTNLGATDVYNFNGVSGNNYSLTLTRVSGSSTYYDPWMMWSDATGASIVNTYTGSTTTYTHAAATGLYTVLVNQLNDANNLSGDYSLEVSGLGTSQPVAGKQDGSTCNCEEDETSIMLLLQQTIKPPPR